MTVVASGFSADRPFSCAQGRYGEVIIAQGGVAVKRWTGSGAATNAGIPAPTGAPSISINTTKRYYVARVDVQSVGSVYHTPPAVSFSTASSPPAGFREAKASAYLSQASLSEIVVTDGGKHYPSAPSVSLSGSHGSGATFTATLGSSGSSATSGALDIYDVQQGPPFANESTLDAFRATQFGVWGPYELNVSNGTHVATGNVWVFHGGVDDDTENCDNYIQIPTSITYSVSGVPAGASGAKCRVNFSGEGIDYAECDESACTVRYHTSCYLDSVEPISGGSGYSSGVTIVIYPTSTYQDSAESCTSATTTGISASKRIVITASVSSDIGTTGQPVASIAVGNGGSGYVVAPDLDVASDSGFGCTATASVTNGAITSVTVTSAGGGYVSAPSVTAVSGKAEAFAVARPHLRGKYQCYYRYVDSTDEAHGGPIPSNLSPLREADAEDGASALTWLVATPASGNRATKAELWRSTGDEALMLYRVTTISSFSGGTASFVDDLTDDELRDPDRSGYSAMPIVLPNGDLNAMRFGVPPDNKSVVIRYQDRFWYGVDTGGSEPNSVYFSEVDEPESVPDINEFVLQQNSRDVDAITALVPFGASMLIMQSRHAYSMSFAKQPLLDADVTPIAYRGCIGQKCWDIFSGICYVLDQQGVYSLSQQGELKDLSAPIDDIVRSQIDWSNTKWNFVAVDAVRKVLRVFVAFVADNSTGYPTRALCYSLDTASWWTERYPHRISSCSTMPLDGGRHRCVYGAEGGAYLLDDGPTDDARGAIISAKVTNGGAGYRTPPKVTAGGGVGAELQSVINASGQVTGIWILSPGTGYLSGSLTISAPDDPDCDDPEHATATFTATTAGDNTPIFPSYRYRTGNREFPTDVTSEGGGAASSRNISVVYKPQESRANLAVRLYYNNSQHARNNVATRNRGTGFVSSNIDGATRIDMSALTTRTGYDTGVAQASFANKTLDDMRSGDRHVAVELVGASTAGVPVVIYSLDVYGTAREQEGK